MAGESGLEAAAVTARPSVAAPTSALAADVEVAASMDERALLARLLEEPWAFDFFQAVNVLQRLAPERAAIGGFADPREESVRLTTASRVAFPASELQGLDATASPPRMTVNFMGLTGPQGALPLAYSLYAAERVRAGDTALKEFLGLFDHRMLSLFYRAWEKTHPDVTHGGDRDWMTRHLLDLIGLGGEAMRDRLPIPDDALLFYAGILALPTRPAAALEQLLGDYFGVPVAVEQFVGAWYALDGGAQTALGDESSGAAPLGLGAVAGDEIWDQQSRVRVRLGPLTRREYDAFLPGGSAHEPLRALTRFYANDLIDFEIQLVLDRDAVPAVRLGDDAALPLGWCTWLRTQPMDRDPEDAMFTL